MGPNMGVLGWYAVWVKNREFYVTPEYGSKYGFKCGFKIWCYGCMLFLIFVRGPKVGHFGRFKWDFIWSRYGTLITTELIKQLFINCTSSMTFAKQEAS